MDSSKILSLLETLDDDIDDLEECILPLVKTGLSETSSKLPLLDKAKLYVLVTYAIESLLFSYLRLNGVKAREHPVFTELTRVKQYFDKIKVAEAPAVDRNMKIDKEAAARFIKASLVGNEKYDLQKAEALAKERAKAHIRFEKLPKDTMKRKTENEEDIEAEEDSESSESEPDSSEHSALDTPEKTVTTPDAPNKKRKLNDPELGPTSTSSTPQMGSKRKNKKTKNQQNPEKARYSNEKKRNKKKNKKNKEGN